MEAAGPLHGLHTGERKEVGLGRRGEFWPKAIFQGSWTAGGSVHYGPPDGVDWRPPEGGGMLVGAWPQPL
jgi:hypothetical protein